MQHLRWRIVVKRQQTGTGVVDDLTYCINQGIRSLLPAARTNQARDGCIPLGTCK